ncbi:MAG: tRNA (adenosine(37)-N6)-threonylcarbamoyltransferase complex dimerization subunit type 1 TsaB [Actinobacteria bacterium]|nr:tRNA (adenosine(37)-N6)-threonylcarbamoyltransferase complex dimerization subunit type 1 TsaB [Actinomycetota bacterium]
MQTILAFDTATSVTACALLHSGAVVGECEAEAKSLLVAADSLVRAAGLQPSDIDGVVVGVGPGSFTSIRIGLAVARGLALGLDVPVAGAPTFAAFAGGRAVIDARRGEVFTEDGVSLPGDLIVEGEVLVGDGAIRYRAVFEAAGAVVPPDDDPSHRPSAALLVGAAGHFGAAADVLPAYFREPDAKPSAG